MRSRLIQPRQDAGRCSYNRHRCCSSRGHAGRIYSGSGNDIVTGNATLATTINGGSGNNILIGGSANDILVGGSNSDILIGGLGNDTLLGNMGDDILIGGTLSFSNNSAGLLAIRNEWTSANPYQTRVDHLHGASAGGLNTIAGGASGNFYLNATTVSVSSTKSTLTGGGDNDWFWANAIDTNDRNGIEDLV